MQTHFGHLSGQYLGYETKGTSSRPFLVPAAATKPPRWRARELRKDVFVFEAVDQVPTARGKLAYSSTCDVRRVQVSNGQLRYDWRLTVVDRDKGLYRINAAGKDCSASALNFGRLGPATMSNGGCRCGSERNLTLMSVSPRTQRISWRFKRAANPALPTPRRPSPPPPADATIACKADVYKNRKVASGRRINSVAYDPCRENRAQDAMACCRRCTLSEMCQGWFFTRLDCSGWGYDINAGVCYMLEDVVSVYEDPADFFFGGGVVRSSGMGRAALSNQPGG
jgi:hypothetical protein